MVILAVGGPRAQPAPEFAAAHESVPPSRHAASVASPAATSVRPGVLIFLAAVALIVIGDAYRYLSANAPFSLGGSLGSAVQATQPTLAQGAMDYSVERWINSPAGSNAGLDWLMKDAAAGAEIVFLALVAIWFIVGWRRQERLDRYGAVGAVLAAGLALGLNQLIALVWARPRPFVTHPTVHVLLSRSTDPSFPSDHAAAAFAIAMVALLMRPRFGLAVMGLACLAAYARVYVGVHYPGDVAGGAVVGLAAGTVLMRWVTVAPARCTEFADRVLLRLGLLVAQPSPP